MTFPKYPFTGQEYEEYRENEYSDNIKLLYAKMKGLMYHFEKCSTSHSKGIAEGIGMGAQLLRQEFEDIIK